MVDFLFLFLSISCLIHVPLIKCFDCFFNLQLRNEAALAVNCINKCGDGGFDELFITKIDFPARYDYCVRCIKGNCFCSPINVFEVNFPLLLSDM